ncbi:MAG: hypothetical protein ABSB59_07320 [Streptosporangiaceae bacterium]|jgi:hypothetical protein
MHGVRYDLDAGENLSSLLAQLNDKLTGLAQLRAGQRASGLDCQPGQWKGIARGQFEDGGGPFGRGYWTEQAALTGLASTALRIKGQVDQANQQFTTLNNQHQPA